MLFSDVERKKYGITPLCESGKGKFISGAADFGTAAWRGHGFHTQPSSAFNFTSIFLILADKKDSYKSLNQFEFCQGPITYYGVSCP